MFTQAVSSLFVKTLKGLNRILVINLHIGNSTQAVEGKLIIQLIYFMFPHTNLIFYRVVQ